MQKLISADDPKLHKDKREKQPSTLQYACSKENVQVLIEIEVIESLYAAMYTENKNPIDQSGVVEVTIIRPKPADSFTHSHQNFATLGTNQGRSENICEFQYHAKPYRRPATSTTNRCRIPDLDRRQNKSFFPENLIEGPAINVDEIVGDLPSEVTSKHRIILPENSMKLHHGDHCDSFISDREIPTKVRDTMPHVNPLVHHVRLEAKAAQENNPLVELSAAEKILEAYEPDISSRCNAKQKLFEAMRKTLAEWGSDQKRITDTLYDDKSSLIRCEHCGVICLKKEHFPLPRVKDDFSIKVDNISRQHLPSGDDGKCLGTRNTETNLCDVDVLNACDQVSRNQSNGNTLRSKTSTCFRENEAARDKLKAQKLKIGNEPKNSLEVKVHDSYYQSDHKIFLQRSRNAENTDEQSVVDTMTMGREEDFLSENVIKMTNVGKKKELKTMLPLFSNNKYRRGINVQKNEKSNDSYSKNISSTRYFPRQIIAKTVKKPVRNTGPDSNQNKNSFKTLNKRTENLSKNSTALRKDSEKTKAQISKNDDTDNDSGNDNETSHAEKCATLLLQTSSRKKKLARALVPPSNIPTKLEKPSSIKPSTSKNVANSYLVREKPSAVFWKGKQSLATSKNKENELQSKADLWSWKSQTLLARGIKEGSQNPHPGSSNMTKNLLRRFTASPDDKLTTDQEYGGNNNPKNSDDDRRSFRSVERRKCDQINLDFNCSAPMIGLPRKMFGNRDFAIDRDLTNDTLPAQYNEESETTAFSSSSSENLIRDWAKSLVQIQRFDCESLPVKSNDDLSSDATRSIKTEIEKAIGRCSTYSVVDSEDTLHRNEILTGETDNSLKSDEKEIFRTINYVNKQYERFKNTNYHHFSTNEAVPSTHPAQCVFSGMENDQRSRGLNNSDCIAPTFAGKEKGEKCKTTDVSQKTLSVGEKANITVGQPEIPKSQKNSETSGGIILNMQKYVAIRTSVSKTINKSSTDTPEMTYENSASVISSNSEFSDEYRQELDVQQRSLCNRTNGSVSQFTESETFERQITYDEISSKDISTESKETLKEATQPAVYRRILESKDEMDWESFQQLVGTLHPSQRELWSDICKAVSNEAKRVAGETGASTEVCIEINPIPTSQAFSCGERRSGVKTSGNEISFEMDMILTDSESFFNQKLRRGSETTHEPEKCH